MCAKHYENPTMLSRVTAKNVGDVFLRHTAYMNFTDLLPRCMECRRGLAMRILSVRPSVCPFVCPSVRLSVTRVYCDKTVERSVQIYIPYERTFSL